MVQQITKETQSHIYAIVETVLIFIGVAILFFKVPHMISGDASVRFEAVSQLLTERKISSMAYSMTGPMFSIPLWFLGKLYKSPEWWCARYNFFIFAFGLFVIYRILKSHISCGVLRKFLLILIFSSMFPRHLMDFYGEVFTAILVGIGILAISFEYSFWGWCSIVLGVLNTPATIIGLGCVVLKKSLEDKRWRYFLVLAVTTELFFAESWIRRGSLFIAGYEGNKGFSTVLPYSGRPDFSYPFFFGLISILFSFGKGIFFFAPGLLLPVRSQISTMGKGLYASYKLWIYFLVGLVLVYSKWWAWYGGGFWGPRFFLFASIPASFALAVRLSSINGSFTTNLLILAVLSLSFWVGINGVAFDQHVLEICTANNFALEFLCWYVPEFSVLWYPFVVSKHLCSHYTSIMVYCIFVFLYLATPLFHQLAKIIVMKFKEFRSMYLDFGEWHF